jgi:hypothetical protein|tara:strand:+ start:772 stop:951 length:180 start_codon:yes stop_codon:yes gene_type:complete
VILSSTGLVFYRKDKVRFFINNHDTLSADLYIYVGVAPASLLATVTATTAELMSENNAG